jgi:hypothetical protein
MPIGCLCLTYAVVCNGYMTSHHMPIGCLCLTYAVVCNGYMTSHHLQRGESEDELKLHDLGCGNFVNYVCKAPVEWLGYGGARFKYIPPASLAEKLHQLPGVLADDSPSFGGEGSGNEMEASEKGGGFESGCNARCAFFDRNLHSRMPLVPTPARLKLLQTCDQCYSSRAFTPLTGWHCKLCRNTKGVSC